MSKQNKLVKEIISVDPQSGKIRLLLFIIAIFIIWTILAFIVSVADPFSTLSSMWRFETHTTSTNLASSLLKDILGNYLSIYAVVYLILLLLSLFTSFLLARSLLGKFLQLNNAKSAGKFLKNCGFSLSTYPIIDANTDKFADTDHHTILTILGGPAYLRIPKSVMGLIFNRISGFQALLNDKTDDELFFIEHGERLSSLFLSREIQTVKTVHALCRDGFKAHIKNIRITYSLNTKFINNSEEQFSLSCKELENLFQEKKMQIIIEGFLQCELKSILLKYSHLEIRELFEEGHWEHAGQTPKAKSSKHKHSIRSHSRRYNSSRSRTAKNENGIILRNRRRSILPEMRGFVEKNIEGNEDIEANFVFIDALSKELSQSVNSIFSLPIININVEELGEVSFDGIY